MPKPRARPVKSAKRTPSVSSHYDAVASRYHEQYDPKTLGDLQKEYPANYFRLQLLLKSFTAKSLKRIVEVGVGEGTPLSTMYRAGMDVWGFDLSQEMVKRSRERLAEIGVDPARIIQGDIQVPSSYAGLAAAAPFDGLMAMGVMPHVENDDAVLRNMGAMVRQGGSVFIEFRNKLFSLFTFNRYTAEFILDDLLNGVDAKVKSVVAKDLSRRLRMDLPPVRTTGDDGVSPGYDAILSKFHNPFEMKDLFERNGFSNIKFLWYHYHPAPPSLASEDPRRFRDAAMALEGEASGWKGFFLCSAFVVEATRV